VKRIAFNIIALIIVLLVVLVAAALSQQISPLTQEAKGPRARGEFTVTNQGILPIAVVLEPVSLGAANGKPVWGPLHGVQVKLSEQSARLGPKQTRVISYEAKCEQQPCAFSIFAKFAQGHTSNGIAVVIHLASTVYVCEKKKGCRESTLRGLGIWQDVARAAAK